MRGSAAIRYPLRRGYLNANRAMPALSVMMRMAELWGYRRHNSNPCRNTRRYRIGRGDACGNAIGRVPEHACTHARGGADDKTGMAARSGANAP